MSIVERPAEAHAHTGEVGFQLVACFESEADAIREAWSRGDGEGMVAAVTDEMIDSIALAGTPEEVRERFAERWDGVYERTLLWPPAFRGEEGVRAVIEAFSAA